MVTIVIEAARDQVPVTIDGKRRKISKQQSAAINSPTRRNGNPKIVLKFLDLLQKSKRAEAADLLNIPFSEVDIKVIRELYKRLRPYDERVND